jgi:cell division septum initiation protein DivIVA
MDQRDEKLHQLANDNRKLQDEVQRLRGELRRATKLVADLSIAHAPEADDEVQASGALAE